MKSPPDWFDLGNYPDGKGAAYWANNIYLRVALSEFAEVLLSTPLGKDQMKGLFLSLSHLSSLVTSRNLRGPRLLTKDEPSVREINFFELERLGEWMKSGSFKSYLSEYRAKWEEGQQFKEGSSVKFLDVQGITVLHKRKLSEFSSPPQLPPIFTVDIDRDTETLVEEFKELIRDSQSRRSAPEVKKKIRQIDFDRWHTYGVLPCFDLKLWSRITDVHLTNADLGDFLWPNGEFDRPLRVRQTTEKYLKTVFTDITYRRVQSIAELNTSSS